jgi:hypothetical protein
VPSLNIVATNPLDHAGDIKELFVAHDRPEFPDFFDRAYPPAVRTGGKSWIGVDADGRVVMHIARFSLRFAFGERTAVGGLLVNLMAAKSHRTVVPALTLMRQMTSDSKADRDVDFLYADPNPAGSALLKAAGFSAVGTLQRFVLPLGDARWYADLAARAYHMFVRIRALGHAARMTEHPAPDFNPDVFARPAGASPALRPFRPPELYQQRLAGYPSRSDHWFTFHANARSARPSAAVLVRGSADRTATLYSVSREPSLPLSAIVPGLATALRRAGYRRLSVSTLAGTRFADELKRAGFIPREEGDLIFGCAVTEVGADVLRAASLWEITELDCDR